jgi:hypothetical protein
LSDAEKSVLNNITELNRRMEHPLNQVDAQGLMFNNNAAAAILTKTIDPMTQQLLNEITKLVQIQETAQESNKMRIAHGRRRSWRGKPLPSQDRVNTSSRTWSRPWVRSTKVRARLPTLSASSQAAGRSAAHGDATVRCD